MKWLLALVFAGVALAQNPPAGSFVNRTPAPGTCVPGSVFQSGTGTRTYYNCPNGTPVLWGSGSGSVTSVTIAGTANEISATGTCTITTTGTCTIGIPAVIDLGGKTSLEIPNGAAPTTSVFGQIAGDNNAWASGRGALQFYDGTANTYLIGALAADTPSNGQVPTWKTGGIVEWETPGGGGTPAGMDCQVQFNDGGMFGASPQLCWDDTAKLLTVGGTGTAPTGLPAEAALWVSESAGASDYSIHLLAPHSDGYVGNDVEFGFVAQMGDVDAGGSPLSANAYSKLGYLRVQYDDTTDQETINGELFVGTTKAFTIAADGSIALGEAAYMGGSPGTVSGNLVLSAVDGSGTLASGIFTSGTRTYMDGNLDYYASISNSITGLSNPMPTMEQLMNGELMMQFVAVEGDSVADDLFLYPLSGYAVTTGDNQGSIGVTGSVDYAGTNGRSHRGVYGSATAIGAVTTETLVGVDALASGSTATVSDTMAAFRGSVTAGAGVAAAYGLKLGNITGATLNYAIHTGTGPWHMEDYIEGIEIAAPAAPAANAYRLFAEDNGGKTRLCALFATGVKQCFASEP